MVEVSIAGGDLASPEMERGALRPLREHRAFIVVFALSAMLSALALTYIYTERYRAEATIFFKPSEVTRLTTHSTQALGSPFPSYTVFKALDQTFSDLVDSDELLRRVVADLHLEVPIPRDMSGPWYVRYYKQIKYPLEDFANDTWMILKWGRIINDPVYAAIARLRSGIKLSSSDSYLYSLKVMADTPPLAVAIADDLGTHLVDSLRQDDLRSSGERRPQVAALRDDEAREIERIEDKMRDLLASSQAASLHDELVEATARASYLLKQQADTAADLRQSDGKVAELGGKLRGFGATSASVERAPPVMRRQSLISAEDYARLVSQKLDAEINSGALRARLDSIERSYAAAALRLQVLNQAQAQYDVLSAQLDAAKRNYNSLSDAYQEAVIQSTTGQGELRFQAKATAPPLPVSPIKIYHVGAAGGLALMIAIGLAYVLDYFGIRLFLPPAGGERRRVGASRAPAPAPESAAARVTVS
jgi:uncharacterized protein involved in exopolysaccharide biosynthesis